MVRKYVRDSDNQTWEYRQVSAVLERRCTYSSYWSTVTGEMMLLMTPEELRHIASVIERKEPSAGT